MPPYWRKYKFFCSILPLLKFNTQVTLGKSKREYHCYENRSDLIWLLLCLQFMKQRSLGSQKASCSQLGRMDLNLRNCVFHRSIVDIPHLAHIKTIFKVLFCISLKGLWNTSYGLFAPTSGKVIRRHPVR